MAQPTPKGMAIRRVITIIYIVLTIFPAIPTVCLIALGIEVKNFQLIEGIPLYPT